MEPVVQPAVRLINKSCGFYFSTCTRVGELKVNKRTEAVIYSQLNWALRLYGASGATGRTIDN